MLQTNPSSQHDRRQFLQTAVSGAIVACTTGRLLAEDASQPDFSFGVVADVQYADVPSAGSRHYAASIDKLRACVDEFNAKDVRFVVQLGDLIDRELASFDPILAVYDTLKMPKYHVLGNHDFSVAGEDRDKVRQRLDVGKGYYQFDCPGWRFLVLDGNDVSIQDSEPGSERRAMVEARMKRIQEEEGRRPLPYNGAMGDEQVAWLETTLTEADEAGRRVALFSHFPLFPSHGLNLWNASQVRAILESHPCSTLHLNGHHHAGMYAQSDGMHYVTLEGMVETPDTTAHAIVEVHTDRLKIVGSGRATSRVLEYSSRVVRV